MDKVFSEIEKSRNPRIFEYIESGVVDLNIQDELGYSMLSIACFKENIRLVEYLLERKINVHLTTFEGKCSAMHIASQTGNIKIVEILYNYDKTQINLLNKNNDSPIMFSTLSGNALLVKFFIQRKALLDIQNSQGLTVLHCILKNGNSIIFYAD